MTTNTDQTKATVETMDKLLSSFEERIREVKRNTKNKELIKVANYALATGRECVALAKEAKAFLKANQNLNNELTQMLKAFVG